MVYHRSRRDSLQGKKSIAGGNLDFAKVLAMPFAIVASSCGMNALRKMTQVIRYNDGCKF